MPAHRRSRDKRPAAEGDEIVLAREPQHPFGVDEEALAPELMGDAAIAVMTVVERDALDEVAQVGVVAFRSLGREIAVVAGARYAAQRAETPNVGVLFGIALRLDDGHLLDDRVEVGAPPLRLVASQSRKASRK